MTQPPLFTFDNSYAQTLKGMYVEWDGAQVPDPKVLRLNAALAEELGLDSKALQTQEGARILAGAVAPEGAEPLAMAYAGHQFGHFSPQLGDGRALLVGEVVDRHGQRRDLHLKGSGRTPFSRGGDGKAVLGPVLREYLMGEAMYALGIPTTRALAAVTTGEEIIREGYQPGAVLARVAASHLRVGTFQFFAARGEVNRLRQLADYAIARHYPDLREDSAPYLGLVRRVAEAQAALIARWMLVGFVHGVMNTDNMTISGETIDYGPCAFMDVYDPATVFSSIDHQGRYAYGNQPQIGLWNLTRFAESLLHLIDDSDTDAAVAQAAAVLEDYPALYQTAWRTGMRAKLGLAGDAPDDDALTGDLMLALHGQSVDYTGFFRALAAVPLGDAGPVRGMFVDQGAIDPWLDRYQARLAQQGGEGGAVTAAMNRTNPIYIPRNHLVEAALQSAVAGDMSDFDRLQDVLAQPFDEREGFDAYADSAPANFGDYVTYCGT